MTHLHNIKRRTNRLVHALTAGLFLVAYGISAATPFLLTSQASAYTAPSGTLQKTDKVDICHATSPGNYNSPNTTVAGILHSSGGAGQAGHTNHDGDIIPPFKYYDDNNVETAYDGKNWTTANQAIYANGCAALVAPRPTPLPSGIADVCGKGNDTVPLAGQNYTVLSDTNWQPDGQDKLKTVRTITYKANDGYIFNYDANNGWVYSEDLTQVTYTFTDQATPCAVPTVKPCVGSTGSTTVNADVQFADYQDTRTKGHYEFTPGGLHIWTEDTSGQSKVAWYHNVTPYPLTDVGDPNMAYTGTGAKPGMQIVIDTNGNGVADDEDGILVGEPSAYGVGKWWSNYNFGVGAGMGYTSYGTLNDYLAKMPNAKVVAVGFSLGSGVVGDGTLKSLTFGCYTWTFEKAAPLAIKPCTASLGSTVVTDMSNVGVGKDGTASLEKNGLRMKTVMSDADGKEAYVNWFTDVTPYSLAEVGKPSLDYTRDSGTSPGMRLTVALNDGSGRTIELVGEPTVPGYGDGWWVLDPATGTGSTVNYGVGSAMGYTNFAPLSAYLTLYPHATVQKVGFSMGWGVNGEGVMHSATFGCYTWTFEKAPVNPQPNPTVSSACGLDIALAIDVSGSIDYDELEQVKAALISMTNALRGTSTEFSVTVFASKATVILPMTGDIDAVNAAIENIDGYGNTNWEDALDKAGGTLPNRMGNPDMVIIASDGDPTASNTSSNHLEDAIAMANKLKANGARILAIGIGDDLIVENLKAIAGPNVNTGNIATTDVITTDFATMAADLANYAKISCPGGKGQGQVKGVQSPASPAPKNVTPAQLEDTGNSLVLPLMMSTGLMGLAIMVTLRNDMRNDSRLGRLLARLRQSLAAPFVVPTA